MQDNLIVWWIPQIPGNAFRVSVRSLREARLLLDTLAQYDLFQLRYRIKPDFANAGGLVVMEGGDEVDWESPDGRRIEVLDAREIDTLDQRS